jgi:recombination protein RecR
MQKKSVLQIWQAQENMAYPRRVQELVEDFARLPGIGPRQAVRFVYALLAKDDSFLASFAGHIRSLKTETMLCGSCFRITEQRPGQACDICTASSRDHNKILVVEKDTDVENFEKSGVFSGMYHVLGGSISALEKNSAEKLHMRELFERVKSLATKNEQVEIIIATSNNLEGNQTAAYIERILEPLTVSVTRLGRGLSTGSEIEYADPMTLEQAINNRK